jgi:PadR family transcriptional regulator PadR
MTEKHGRPITRKGFAILAAFIENPRLEISGADIIKRTGMLSGTLYPILARFEREGLLSSRWEKEEPSDLGRPRRRLYQITALGRRTLLTEATEMVGGRISWAM